MGIGKAFAVDYIGVAIPLAQGKEATTTQKKKEGNPRVSAF